MPVQALAAASIPSSGRSSPARIARASSSRARAGEASSRSAAAPRPRRRWRGGPADPSQGLREGLVGIGEAPAPPHPPRIGEEPLPDPHPAGPPGRTRRSPPPAPRIGREIHLEAAAQPRVVEQDRLLRQPRQPRALPDPHPVLDHAVRPVRAVDLLRRRGGEDEVAAPRGRDRRGRRSPQAMPPAVLTKPPPHVPDPGKRRREGPDSARSRRRVGPARPARPHREADRAHGALPQGGAGLPFRVASPSPAHCLFRRQRLRRGRPVEDAAAEQAGHHSTSTRAERPRSSRNGFSSTTSSEPTRPQSCSISMMRCASRKVAPPGTAVPTAGAMEGRGSRCRSSHGDGRLPRPPVPEAGAGARRRRTRRSPACR